MKNINRILLIAILTAFNFYGLSAQESVTVSNNDRLIIELDGYKNGEIWWERATDKDATKWSAISITTAPTLEYKITAPGYFRSKVSDGTCDPVCSDVIKVNVINASDKFIVKAGHGYVYPHADSSPGITMRENSNLSNWTNIDRRAVWYLYQQAGMYDVNFNMKSSSKKDFQFEMKTSACYEGLDYEGESFSFTCSSAGGSKSETLPAFTVKIPTTGYYRYELNAKSSMSGLTIDELIFNGVREPGSASLKTNATTYLSSPSVHLSFSSTAATTKSYDWAYEEILVPEGYDPLSSYYMSIGFFAGYMGIQTNSLYERRVLFSVWDIADRDKWPDAPKEALVSLVDKADYTQANSFGNEGTGGQSYVGSYNFNTWKTGTPVKFLMNARRDGGIIAHETIAGIANKGDSIRHTVVSAWYDAGEGWRYIATWRCPRKPTDGVMFDGFYSFIENYGWRNGQLPRKAYYYNAFGRERTTGRWVHFNKTGFSNTDGATGQRIDFEQGASTDPGHEDKFYMLSGGYGKTHKGETTVPLIDIEDFPTLNELDLTPFIERVDLALRKESGEPETDGTIQYLNKNGWKVLSFTSEQTSGEGTNGPANLTIDGDDNTYWHSKYSGITPVYPHRFVIDMTKENLVEGFRFISSDKNRRWPKRVKVEASNTALSLNATEWESNIILDVDDLDAIEHKLTLPKASTFRYFRFSILSGQNDGDGAHIRINEISPFVSLKE